MPEIDNDLFKLLVVVLLALSTLLLLAALSALGGVRKLLKQQVEQTEDLRKDLSTGTTGAAGPLPAATSTGDEPAETAPTPTEEPAAAQAPATPLLGGAASPSAPAVSDSSTSADEAWGLEPSASTTPSPVSATDTPEDPVSTPARPDAEDPFAAAGSSTDDPFTSSVDDPFGTSTGDASATATGDDPFSSTSAEDPFARPASDAGAGSAAEPSGAQETPGGASEESPFATEAPSESIASGGAASGAVDEPEEQPFERNGKWFFRREGELLVYEEGTGEWIPADESALQPAPPPAATSSGYSTETPSEAEPGDVGGGPGGDTEQFDTVEPRPAAGGGFWKCPSCGAVNGSSATTCRMCFSARP